MSNNDKEYKGSTFWQLMIAIPGSILGFTLLISLLAKSLGPTAEAPTLAPAAVAAKVEGNVKPVAEVALASADKGAHVNKSGEEVVKSVCSACHSAGLMGSPKIGDKSQWGPRIAQGYETLVNHAIHGVRMMPAKGGNPDLTDGEIANAVAYMANQAGAHFTAPAADASATPAKTPVDTDKVSDKSAKTATPAKKDAGFVDQVAATAPKPVEKTEPAKVAVAEPQAVEKVEKTEPAKVAASGKSGEQVFKAVCSMCHATGLMESPKFGDKEAWAPRIAQGYDTLVDHAIHGVRMMPAKGGNPGLSDEEVARAVAYMANEAGANFKAN